MLLADCQMMGLVAARDADEKEDGPWLMVKRNLGEDAENGGDPVAELTARIASGNSPGTCVSIDPERTAEPSYLRGT